MAGRGPTRSPAIIPSLRKHSRRSTAHAPRRKSARRVGHRLRNIQSNCIVAGVAQFRTVGSPRPRLLAAPPAGCWAVRAGARGPARGTRFRCTARSRRLGGGADRDRGRGSGPRAEGGSRSSPVRSDPVLARIAVLPGPEPPSHPRVHAERDHPSDSASRASSGMEGCPRVAVRARCRLSDPAGGDSGRLGGSAAGAWELGSFGPRGFIGRPVGKRAQGSRGEAACGQRSSRRGSRARGRARWCCDQRRRRIEGARRFLARNGRRGRSSSARRRHRPLRSGQAWGEK